MQNDLRTIPRYFLPNGVAAMLADSSASVVDLSLKGARLQVNRQLPLGERLGFVLSSGGSTIRTNVTVLWCQMAALALDQNESDVYLAGVVFDHALTEVGSILDRLIATDAAMLIQDARTTERYNVMSPLNASFGDRDFDAQVLDLSTRGARVSMQHSVRVGAHGSLRFSFEEGPVIDLASTVIWCRKSERNDCYEIGLTIPGEEARLGAVIAKLCMNKNAKVDLNSLRRKFDPLRSMPRSGLVALAS